MFDQSVVSMIVDVLFAGLVMATCFFSLTKDGEAGAKKLSLWHQELGDLQNALKELIEDAGVASNNLDRRLLKRKEELEKVLAELESKEQTLCQNAATKAEDSSSLPNSSWLEQDIERESVADYEKLVSEYEIWHSEKPRQVVPKNSQVLQPKVAELAVKQEKVQKEKQQLDESQQLTLLKRTLNDNIDIQTYRVAKRLISQGHNTSVVARKMQIPASQVRIIENVIKDAEGLDLRESWESERSSAVNMCVVNGQTA
ncbi:MAG: hypothetical protein IT292_11870 [Deltaproteobacteria bacterium]|nr:hypothetical protein [Deltaproteobacteria bacterium]